MAAPDLSTNYQCSEPPPARGGWEHRVSFSILEHNSMQSGAALRLVTAALTPNSRRCTRVALCSGTRTTATVTPATTAPGKVAGVLYVGDLPARLLKGRHHAVQVNMSVGRTSKAQE